MYSAIMILQKKNGSLPGKILFQGEMMKCSQIIRDITEILHFLHFVIVKDRMYWYTNKYLISESIHSCKTDACEILVKRLDIS